MGLRTVQIITLVEYSPEEEASGLEEFSVEDGFSIEDERETPEDTGAKAKSAKITGAEKPDDFDDEIPF